MTRESLETRRTNHYRHASKAVRKSYFQRALLAHPDIVFEKILIADIDYCFEIENKLRPTKRIGWNCMPGGKQTGPMTDSQWSEAKSKEASERLKRMHREDPSIAKRISESNKGKKLSDVAKVRMSAAKKCLQPWEQNHANKALWVNAQEIFEIMQIHLCIGVRNLSKIVPYTPDQLNKIHKLIRSGWIPMLDPAWVAKYKEQKK